MSKTETYKQRAMDYIRDSLIYRRIAQGERITAERIAKAIGISIAPAREAIMELASQGLLEYRPNVGAVVRRITVKEVRQYMQLRLLIEPFAASEAATNASLEKLMAIGEKLAVMSACDKELAQVRNDPELFAQKALAMNTADMNFHLAIFDAADNIALTRFARQLTDCFYLFSVSEMWGSTDPELFLERSPDTLETHTRIYHALRMRDAQQAHDAVRQSLLSSGIFTA